MNLFLDSFWRALAYCLRARVIALSFLPLVLMIALTLGLGYWYWDAALDWVRSGMEAGGVFSSLGPWLNRVGLGTLKMVLAPLLVIFGVTPLIVLLSLLAVATLMTPALTLLVAQRRFPQLERLRGGGLVSGTMRALGLSLLALLAMLLSSPLWLVPPLILVLPPLIWGWLTYRIMAYDALAEHASAQERREIFRQHRGWLLVMGVLCGFMGAAPSLIWACGALLAAAFVLLVPLAVWIYTLVFAFSSLWFAHYCLAALQTLRAQGIAAPPPVIGVPALTLPHEPSPPTKFPA